jgi:hypothetical protein
LADPVCANHSGHSPGRWGRARARLPLALCPFTLQEMPGAIHTREVGQLQPLPPSRAGTCNLAGVPRAGRETPPKARGNSVGARGGAKTLADPACVNRSGHSWSAGRNEEPGTRNQERVRLGRGPAQEGPWHRSRGPYRWQNKWGSHKRQRSAQTGGRVSAKYETCTHLLPYLLNSLPAISPSSESALRLTIDFVVFSIWLMPFVWFSIFEVLILAQIMQMHPKHLNAVHICTPG